MLCNVHSLHTWGSGAWKKKKEVDGEKSLLPADEEGRTGSSAERQ